jgi:hypothetical protein
VRILTSLFGAHRWFDANVDAFADGELRPSDRARFEAHLAGCDRCERAVQMALGTRSLLRALPELSVTRSFALTEAMVRAPARPAPNQAGGFMGPIRAVQGLGAASVALFAVLVVADLGGGASSPASMSSPQSDESFSATAASDGDSAQPVSGALEDNADSGGQPAGGDDSSTEPDDEGGQVEGAGVNSPEPLPTPAPGGGSELVPAGDPEDATRQSGGQGDEAFTTIALAAQEDDGLNRLRVAQFASAGLALAAATMYAGLRFRGTRAR